MFSNQVSHRSISIFTNWRVDLIVAFMVLAFASLLPCVTLAQKQITKSPSAKTSTSVTPCIMNKDGSKIPLCPRYKEEPQPPCIMGPESFGKYTEGQLYTEMGVPVNLQVGTLDSTGKCVAPPVQTTKPHI